MTARLTLESAIQRQVTVDALKEFIAARTPIEDYIARRYGSHSKTFRERRLVCVSERVAAAEAILRKDSLYG